MNNKTTYGICFTILLLIVLYFYYHEEPKRLQNDKIIYTDKYEIFMNTDSISVDGKIYKVKCRITANQFKKPGKDKSGYYEKLFYIKNDTIYKTTDHDHESLIEVSGSRIIGDTLYCKQFIQDKVAPITKKYRIASNIDPYPFHRYFTIIDGIVVNTCHKDFTGWMIFGIIVFIVCTICYISIDCCDGGESGAKIFAIIALIFILIGFLCFW